MPLAYFYICARILFVLEVVNITRTNPYIRWNKLLLIVIICWCTYMHDLLWSWALILCTVYWERDDMVLFKDNRHYCVNGTDKWEASLRALWISSSRRKEQMRLDIISVKRIHRKDQGFATLIHTNYCWRLGE